MSNYLIKESKESGSQSMKRKKITAMPKAPEIAKSRISEIARIHANMK